MAVTFHEAAYTELSEAVAYYNKRAPGLGDALAEEVQGGADKILPTPEAGFIVRPHLRRFLLARFPYSLLYQATGDRVRILAVMHHRRRPDYWQNRV